MPKTVERYRLFFALWPEVGLRTRIQQAVDKPLQIYCGYPISLHNWHTTLAFIGSVDADTMHCMQEAASQLRAEPFTLSLDYLAYWPRPKVIYLAPRAIPVPLIDLQTSLNQVLATNCGYQAEIRPYRPHLSLIRKAKDGPDDVDISPLGWQVRSFCLIQSKTHAEGVEYEVLNSWPLL